VRARQLRPAELGGIAEPIDLVVVARRHRSTVSLREGIDAVNRCRRAIRAKYVVLAALTLRDALTALRRVL
jgi:hypothetical protein